LDRIGISTYGQGETLAQFLDEKEVLARVGGELDLLDELIGLLRTECDSAHERIHDALKMQDESELLDATHKLRGAVSHFSAPEVSAAAELLETLVKDGEIESALTQSTRLQELTERLLEVLSALVKENSD